MVFPLYFWVLFAAAMLISAIGFKQYVKTVPILLPFVPLYSVEKYKWLVG